ncbi:hypothetical protein B0I00_2703 [Novosphingobium kunmingense]|uniref:Uncharacterized protein n=1 Tax=Novosphingobium kunmingense TaxID=1211806 RepID=A0A2N0H563_9SPHN|nr:hypothetical protein [Novosphingobium kunmingense]PKB14075.1 hypothetical protein B0I00_2703 [Novosphingobium kunmingense]
MATVNPADPNRMFKGRRRLRRLLWLAAIALAAALAWFWQPLNGYARVGTAYGARVACSCRYEGGRSLADCRKDFEDGMELITLSEDSAAKTVTARFPILASDSASYVEGEGCRLKPWPR